MKYMMLALMLVGCTKDELAASKRSSISYDFTCSCRHHCESYAGFELKVADDALMCQCIKYEDK